MESKRQTQRVFVIGCGMTRFLKPGRPTNPDYPEMAKTAAYRALHDAGISFNEIEQATVSYVYGDSTSGQRALYEIGMSGIPVYNVNNNCCSGATAIQIGAKFIQGGLYDCVMALGFEKMQKGSLKFGWPDREMALGPHKRWLEQMAKEGRGYEFKSKFPLAPQFFGNAGIEYMKKYGVDAEPFAKIGEKNHKHSINNPYSQFRDVYTLDQIQKSRHVFGPMTMLQCCPTSDGAGCIILASEDYVIKNGLQDQAVEILDIQLGTDKGNMRDSAMNLVGYDMTRQAVDKLYKNAGVTPEQVQVVELHDCFSANELITYEALRLCPEGGAKRFIDSGDNTYGGRVVVNPSGGLISKGHPLGATGMAQCSELCWQLRNMACKRQVPNAQIALQHNLGLGGAVVIALYRKYNKNFNKRKDQSSDPEILEAMERNNALLPQKLNDVENISGNTNLREKL